MIRKREPDVGVGDVGGSLADGRSWGVVEGVRQREISGEERHTGHHLIG